MGNVIDFEEAIKRHRRRKGKGVKPGRPPLEDERLEQQWTRLSPSTKEDLQHLASQNGMNPSEYLRALVEWAVEEGWLFHRNTQ